MKLNWTWGYQSQFRFHNSSIKRGVNEMNRTKFPRFRFHNSSIKSDLSMIFCLDGHTCFDSTIVRLKGGGEVGPKGQAAKGVSIPQ